MSERSPERGEIWWVDFEPAVGSEARKNRPSVVLNSVNLNHVAVRLVVPLTSWQERFGRQLNKVRVAATSDTGLYEESAADVLLTRGVSLDRFGDRMGAVPQSVVDDIARALAIVAAVPR